MDTVTRYREVVRRLVQEYGDHRPYHGQIEAEVVVDPEHDHYQVMHVGWDGPRRVHGTVIHVDILGDKIWIQYDGTDRPIAEELMQAGVPQDAIVLGFHPPDMRRHTGFATG